MNKQHAFEVFKSQGFKVEMFDDGVFVSLNRAIDKQEVFVASHYQISDMHMMRVSDNEIAVLCPEI